MTASATIRSMPPTASPTHTSTIRSTSTPPRSTPRSRRLRGMNRTPDPKGRTLQTKGLIPQEVSVSKGLPPRTKGLTPQGVVDISKEWTVEFSGLGAPKGIFKFPVLASWSEHEIDGIRYLAGHGIYRREFVFDLQKEKNTRWTLDLGQVRDVATVSLNGGKSICLLEPPYRIDATDLLVQGTNIIEIDVVNCWPNRLIGDARLRAKKVKEPRSTLGNWPAWVLDDKPGSGSGIYTWSTYGGVYPPDTPLLPAGLLGPVTIRNDIPVACISHWTNTDE